MISLRTQITLTRSLLSSSRPTGPAAKYACACMKHVAGFPNSPGTRIIVPALLRVQSSGPGAIATEHTSTRAVSILTPDAIPTQTIDSASRVCEAANINLDSFAQAARREGSRAYPKQNNAAPEVGGPHDCQCWLLLPP